MYYEQINKAVARAKGGLTSAPLVIESLDLAPVAALELAGEWDEVGSIVAGAASRLEAAGAEGLILCSNTTHKVAPAVEAAVKIPLLHIADVTADLFARIVPFDREAQRLKVSRRPLRGGPLRLGLLRRRLALRQGGPFHRLSRP